MTRPPARPVREGLHRVIHRLQAASGVATRLRRSTQASADAAAEKGDANAQFSLAEIYDMGRGVVQDDAEAVRWYRRAADQGHVQAQHNLGVAYALGSSVPEDLVAAYMWLSLAADRASADDRDIWVAERDTEAKAMTPEQIAEAERLAREWKPTQPSR